MNNQNDNNQAKEDLYAMLGSLQATLTRLDDGIENALKLVGNTADRKD